MQKWRKRSAAPRERVLSEDELAVFDLLTKPKPTLTKPQEIAVKKVARDLLAKLQDYFSVDNGGQKRERRKFKL